MGYSDTELSNAEFDGFGRDLKRARKKIDTEIWRIRKTFSSFTLDDFLFYLEPDQFEKNLGTEGEYIYSGSWFNAELGISGMDSHFLRIKAREIPRIKIRYTDDQRIDELYERVKAALAEVSS